MMTTPDPIAAHLSRAESTKAAIAARREAFEAEQARRREAAAQPLTLETYRRLHEEATKRAAAYRIALEAIVEAHGNYLFSGYSGPMFDAIAEARKVLAS